MEKSKKANHRINGGALIPIGTAGAKRYYQVNANNPNKTDSVIVGNKLAVDNGEVVEVKGNTIRVASADLGTTNLMANLMKNNPIDKAFNMAYNTQETLKNNIGMNDDGTMKANKGGKTKLNLYPRRGVVLGSSPLVTLLNRMTRNHISDFTKSPFIPNIKRKQTGGEDYSVRFNEFEAQNKDASKDKVSKIPKVNFAGIKTTRNRPYNPDYISFINDALVKNNINSYQRASILANIIEESGGDPFADSGTGFYGLLQWANDRYKYNGEKDVYKELQNQTDYIISTMNNADDKVSWTHGGKGSGYNSYKDAMAAFNGEDINGVMHGYTLGYVRPTGKQNSYNNRLKVYNQLLGLEGFKNGGRYTKHNDKTTIKRNNMDLINTINNNRLLYGGKRQYNPSPSTGDLQQKRLGGDNPTNEFLLETLPKVDNTKLLKTMRDAGVLVPPKVKLNIPIGTPSAAAKRKIFWGRVGDWFGKPQNQTIVGSIADSIGTGVDLVNNLSAIKDLQTPSTPAYLSAPSMLTTYNINGSKSVLDSAYGIGKEDISLNTASSAVKQARLRRLAEQIKNARLQLEENKVNQETELINQNKINQANIAAYNNKLYNEYQQNVTAFNNQKRLMRAQAISDAVNSAGQIVGNLVSGLANMGMTNVANPNGTVPLNLQLAYKKVNSGFPVPNYATSGLFNLARLRNGGKKKIK